MLLTFILRKNKYSLERRDISILDGQYFKESDQDTAIIIRLLDDSFQTTPTLADIQILLKNEDDQVIDTFKPDAINDDGDLVLSSDQLDKLKPATYDLEVWVTSNDKKQVYPSETNPSITINSSLPNDNGDTAIVSYSYLKSELDKIWDAIHALQNNRGGSGQPVIPVNHDDSNHD